MVYLASYNRNFSHINHTTLTIRDRQARLFCRTFFSNPGKNGASKAKNKVFSGRVENSSSEFVPSSTTKPIPSTELALMVEEISPRAVFPKVPRLHSVSLPHPHEIVVVSVLFIITASFASLRSTSAKISSVVLSYAKD